MKVQGIIFDLDGTLVDTIDDLGDAANTLFRRHGYQEHRKEDFLSWIGNGAKRFIQRGMGEELGDELLLKYVLEFKDIYAENLAEKSKLYEGVAELLNSLEQKETRLAVLSNKPHNLTREVVRHYLRDWPFEQVFGQRDHVPRKPDPSAAMEIAELMKLNPGNILFVGDSEGDIKTAESAGMVPVGVSWGYGKLDIALEKGYKIIEHPSELMSLLNE